MTFGNGVRGARVPTGTANIKAMYRYGMGSDGNVDAGQISQLATHPLGAQGVINPLPASGGADPDTLSQARINAPLSVTALDRLVSVSDYADFCRVYAGIGKSSAVRLSDGRQLTVHVTVAGVEDSPIDMGSDLYANLLASLQTYGDPHQPVELAVRRVRLIVLAATVGLSSDYFWDDVAPNGSRRRTGPLRLRRSRARTGGVPERGGGRHAGGEGRRLGQRHYVRQRGRGDHRRSTGRPCLEPKASPLCPRGARPA